MDDIVKQALLKWPNVPHCYGWLALDARGGWRMRDERAQALNLPGDRIMNAALLAFINRNYLHDDQGRWYFQNGPQRVYVNLAATPYIAHTDPQHGFVLHTGEPLSAIEKAWMTETGELLLQSAERIAMVDDRDLAQCIPQLLIHEQPVSDEQLLDWLAAPFSSEALTLWYGMQSVVVNPIATGEIASRFGFERMPRPGEAKPNPKPT